MLHQSGLADSLAAAQQQAVQALDSGKAAERFAHMVAALDGPTDILSAYAQHLPLAPIARPVFTDAVGYISAVDTRALGLAVVALGGGRRTSTDVLDYGVGLDQVLGSGALVDQHTPLATVYARTEQQWQQAAEVVRSSFTITDSKAPVRPVIYEQVISD
jgi:thymidine phosphorylase